MNSRMKNIIRKHKKAQRRLTERRQEGLAKKAAMKGQRRKRKVIEVAPVVEAVNTEKLNIQS